MNTITKKNLEFIVNPRITLTFFKERITLNCFVLEKIKVAIYYSFTINENLHFSPCFWFSKSENWKAKQHISVLVFCF